MPESHEVTKYGEPELISLQTQRFELEQRLANLFVASGLFSDIRGQTIEQSIAQAYVKIAIGHSMGFSPVESMQGIDIIQGRPVVSSQLRAGRMQRAGYSWNIDRLDNTGCELTVKNGTGVLGKASFLEADARAMGLLAKDNWKKDPSSMYFARAITRAQRRYAPGVLSLDIPTPDEAYDFPAESVITLPSQSAMIATANKTEELKEKINAAGTKKHKEVSPAEQPRAGVPEAETQPSPKNEGADKAPALGDYPFGKPYAELESWQKDILAVMGNLTQAQGMAALSSAGIMSLEEIWGEKITVALKALRDAVTALKDRPKDLF